MMWLLVTCVCSCRGRWHTLDSKYPIVSVVAILVTCVDDVAVDGMIVATMVNVVLFYRSCSSRSCGYLLASLVMNVRFFIHMV